MMRSRVEPQMIAHGRNGASKIRAVTVSAILLAACVAAVMSITSSTKQGVATSAALATVPDYSEVDQRAEGLFEDEESDGEHSVLQSLFNAFDPEAKERENKKLSVQDISEREVAPPDTDVYNYGKSIPKKASSDQNAPAPVSSARQVEAVGNNKDGQPFDDTNDMSSGDNNQPSALHIRFTPDTLREIGLEYPSGHRRVHGFPHGKNFTMWMREGEYISSLELGVVDAGISGVLKVQTNKRAVEVPGAGKGSKQVTLTVPKNFELVGFNGRAGLGIFALGLSVLPPARAENPEHAAGVLYNLRMSRIGQTPQVGGPQGGTTRRFNCFHDLPQGQYIRIRSMKWMYNKDVVYGGIIRYTNGAECKIGNTRPEAGNSKTVQINPKEYATGLVTSKHKGILSALTTVLTSRRDVSLPSVSTSGEPQSMVVPNGYEALAFYGTVTDDGDSISGIGVVYGKNLPQEEVESEVTQNVDGGVVYNLKKSVIRKTKDFGGFGGSVFNAMHGFVKDRQYRIRRIMLIYNKDSLVTVQCTYTNDLIMTFGSAKRNDEDMKFVFEMADNEYLTGLNIFASKGEVKSVSMLFTTNRIVPVPGAGRNGIIHELRAPFGNEVFGFFGRGGLVVDSLGAIYGRTPSKGLTADQVDGIEFKDKKQLTKSKDIEGESDKGKLHSFDMRQLLPQTNAHPIVGLHLTYTGLVLTRITTVHGDGKAAIVDVPNTPAPAGYFFDYPSKQHQHIELKHGEQIQAVSFQKSEMSSIGLSTIKTNKRKILIKSIPFDGALKPSKKWLYSGKETTVAVPKSPSSCQVFGFYGQAGEKPKLSINTVAKNSDESEKGAQLAARPTRSKLLLGFVAAAGAVAFGVKKLRSWKKKKEKAKDAAAARKLSKEMYARWRAARTRVIEDKDVAGFTKLGLVSACPSKEESKIKVGIKYTGKGSFKEAASASDNAITNKPWEISVSSSDSDSHESLDSTGKPTLLLTIANIFRRPYSKSKLKLEKFSFESKMQKDTVYAVKKIALDFHGASMTGIGMEYRNGKTIQADVPYKKQHAETVEEFNLSHDEYITQIETATYDRQVAVRRIFTNKKVYSVRPVVKSKLYRNFKTLAGDQEHFCEILGFDGKVQEGKVSVVGDHDSTAEAPGDSDILADSDSDNSQNQHTELLLFRFAKRLIRKVRKAIKHAKKTPYQRWQEARREKKIPSEFDSSGFRAIGILSGCAGKSVGTSKAKLADSTTFASTSNVFIPYHDMQFEGLGAKIANTLRPKVRTSFSQKQLTSGSVYKVERVVIEYRGPIMTGLEFYMSNGKYTSVSTNVPTVDGVEFVTPTLRKEVIDLEADEHIVAFEVRRYHTVSISKIITTAKEYGVSEVQRSPEFNRDPAVVLKVTEKSPQCQVSGFSGAVLGKVVIRNEDKKEVAISKNGLKATNQDSKLLLVASAAMAAPLLPAAVGAVAVVGAVKGIKKMKEAKEARREQAIRAAAEEQFLRAIKNDHKYVLSMQQVPGFVELQLEGLCPAAAA